MTAKIERTLENALRNWKAMSGSGNEDAEAAADQFEASFYLFIDAVREWFQGLDQQPQTLEEFLELPVVRHMLEQLPAPLHLNFETEAELIVDHISRIDEDKYDE